MIEIRVNLGNFSYINIQAENVEELPDTEEIAAIAAMAEQFIVTSEQPAAQAVAKAATLGGVVSSTAQNKTKVDYVEFTRNAKGDIVWRLYDENNEFISQLPHYFDQTKEIASWLTDNGVNLDALELDTKHNISPIGEIFVTTEKNGRWTNVKSVSFV